MPKFLLTLIFLFPYSQIGLLGIGYALSVLANIKRQQNKIWLPFTHAKQDWKLADTLALIFYMAALLTGLMYLLIAGSIEG